MENKGTAISAGLSVTGMLFWAGERLLDRWDLIPAWAELLTLYVALTLGWHSFTANVKPGFLRGGRTVGFVVIGAAVAVMLGLELSRDEPQGDFAAYQEMQRTIEDAEARLGECEERLETLEFFEAGYEHLGVIDLDWIRPGWVIGNCNGYACVEFGVTEGLTRYWKGDKQLTGAKVEFAMGRISTDREIPLVDGCRVTVKAGRYHIHMRVVSDRLNEKLLWWGAERVGDNQQIFGGTETVCPDGIARR